MVLRWRLRAAAGGSARTSDDGEAGVVGIGDEGVAGLRKNHPRRIGVNAGQKNRAPWGEAQFPCAMRLRDYDVPEAMLPKLAGKIAVRPAAKANPRPASEAEILDVLIQAW